MQIKQSFVYRPQNNSLGQFSPQKSTITPASKPKGITEGGGLHHITKLHTSKVVTLQQNYLKEWCLFSLCNKFVEKKQKNTPRFFQDYKDFPFQPLNIPDCVQALQAPLHLTLTFSHIVKRILKTNLKISDCVQVIGNPGTYVVRPTFPGDRACGVYIAGLHDEIITVDISFFDVSCSNGGIVAVSL